MPFWLLNDASTVTEKIAYMRACNAGGVRSLVMHCRTGNLVPYASTTWFEMIKDLVEEGRRLGMAMWLYDEDPYPSGAAGGMVMETRPDLSALYVDCRAKPENLKPGQLWFISHRQVLWAGLVPLKRPLPAKDLTGLVGTVRSDWFVTRWDSRYYYPTAPYIDCPRGDAIDQYYTMYVPEVPEGYRLVALTLERAGVDGPWGALPDLLHYDTFRVFRELSLDKYESYVGRHYGRTIPGVFTDEAKPHGGTPVTQDLFTSFRQQYGYDLKGRMYQLFGSMLSDEYMKTRVDYRQWVTERFLDAFLRPYRRYCEDRNLWLVGHMSPEDDPCQESITIGSVMPIMRLMAFPGTDLIIPLTGDRRAPCLNIGSLRAASVKAQAGATATTSETLACSRWSVTTEKTRQIYAWQMVLGIDRFFTHGFWNSNEGVAIYEAPPEFGPYSSLFRGTSEVTRWMERVAPWLDGGRDAAQVGILNNMLSYWAIPAGSLIPSDPRNDELRHALEQTVVSCLEGHVGIHFADEPDVAAAVAKRGMLPVGKHSYRAILVPAAELISEEALRSLRRAVENGVQVYWFGNGPRRIMTAAGRLVPCGTLPGQVVRDLFPSTDWCMRNLPQQAAVGGRGATKCYLRRFTTAKREACLFACNVADKDTELRLPVEQGGLAWSPIEVDGDVTINGDGTCWRLPGCGCGLFRLRPLHQQDARSGKSRRATGEHRAFKRVGLNLLRLSEVEIVAHGKKPVRRTEPYPYWQVFKDYSATRVMDSFAGGVPLMSTVPHPDLRYRFVFSVSNYHGTPVLVLDPRCARGDCHVYINGRQSGALRHFPLENITPQRMRVTGLRRGRNVLELRFQARSAMEGLLTQIYLEGNFDVDVEKGSAVLSAPRVRDSRRGWHLAGMPYYMGDGVYEWREEMSPAEAGDGWVFETDRLVDSGELFVNGRSAGTCAWRPWRWNIPRLKAGTNQLRLVVSGTAGNKHEMDWPEQPQGWIGGGWLVRRA